MTKVTIFPPQPVNTRVRATQAAALAARLPLIVLEARRVSALLTAGLHGRGRAGEGESFWQYRPFSTGESASRIDWRRSARHEAHFFVREREWEAAHTVYLWVDRSASMQFASDLAPISKADRALVIGLALADLLVRSGESVGLIGLAKPTASRRVIDLFAEALLSHPAEDDEAIPALPLTPRSEAVLISDFIAEEDNIAQSLAGLASFGARGHLVRIIDPAEALFPFSGQTELRGVETRERLDIGDASAFRVGYLETMAVHGQALQRLSAQKGWTVDTHGTDRPASEVLRALINRITTR